VIALGGVIVNNVEDDFDACGVQVFDHSLKFANLFTEHAAA
jgi:hypothetical protein